MNTAVCMYGFLRTFKQTSQSLIKHVLEVNHADLYIFAPNTAGISIIPEGQDITSAKFDDLNNTMKMDVSGETVSYELLKEIYGNYTKSIKLYEYDQMKFVTEAKGYSDFGKFPSYRCFSMFYNISHSIQMIVNQSDVKYDAVILLRPDLAFYSDIVIEHLDLNKINIPQGGGILNNGLHNIPQYHVAYYKNTQRGELIRANSQPFTDQLIITSFDNIKILSDAYKRLKELNSFGIPLHPETIVYYLTAYKQNKEVAINPGWLYEIFRNNYNSIENDTILNQQKNSFEFDNKINCQPSKHNVKTFFKKTIRKFILWLKEI